MQNKFLFILCAIIAFSFLVRVVGMGYGLPLWLVDDEPPFTLAALKMIQLKTLLPASYLEDFKTVLYYPPYLSYLYLLPFSALLGLKYLIFSGGITQFVYYLSSDLSQFFLIARFLNIALGIFSIFLVYKIARDVFKSSYAGLLSAFFLSSSLFHILMSSNGRHWLPVSLFTALVVWLLACLKMDFRKRYLLAISTVGIGMGISPINGLLLLLIFYWYLFYEKRKPADLFKEKYFYLSLVIFIFLAVLPGVLYTQSFGFRNDITLQQTKSIGEAIASPFLFLKPVALSDPVLAVFAALGLLFSFFHFRNFFWPVFLFLYTYSAAFYLFFRYEHRFTLPIFPLLVLLAAYGFIELYRRSAAKPLSAVLLVILAAPLFFSLQLSYLLYKNDSRRLLREWAMENLPADSKIMVLARLTRLPSSPAAIQEQKSLDPKSLRKVDVAEANLMGRTGNIFHALNLHDVQNQDFYDNLENYIRDHKYQYLFIGSTDIRDKERLERFQKIAAQGVLLKSFGEFQEVYSPYIGQLLGNPLGLFKLKEFGPLVTLYKLF